MDVLLTVLQYSCIACVLVAAAAPGVLIVVGAIAVQRLIPGARETERRLARAPEVPIGSLVPDSVQRITGTVVHIEPLENPMGGGPCVYWDLTVKQRGRYVPRVLSRRHVATPFWLRDDTGTAHVDLQGVQVNLRRRVIWRSARMSDPAEHARAMLAVANVTLTRFLGLNPVIWIEGAQIAVGERVTVMGRVGIREVDGAAAFAILPDEHGKISVSLAAHAST